MYKKLKAVLKDILACNESKEIARQADRNSAHITHHNYAHFSRARVFATSVARKVEALYPGTFDKVHIAFHSPVAGFSHDFDRSLKVAQLVAASQIDAMLKARGVSARDRMIVRYAIANHSAGPSRAKLRYKPDVEKAVAELRTIMSSMDLSRGELKQLDAILSDEYLLAELLREARLILATTVIGDKADCGRKRVRAPWMRKMEALVASGEFLQKFPSADDDLKNWMTNYAIVEPTVYIDPKDNGGNPRYRGTLVFHWALDPRLNQDDNSTATFVETALSTVWVRRGMHGVENAAQNILKLNFAIEVGFAGDSGPSKRWFFDKNRKLWLSSGEPVSRIA